MFRITMIQMEVEEKIKQNQRKWDDARQSYRVGTLRHAEYIRQNGIYTGANKAYEDILEMLKGMLNESPGFAETKFEL